MNKIHQIYFLQRADGLIKIGTTTNLDARVAALSASHGMLGVVRVINGDVRRERSLHRKFRKYHEYGEWFRDERGALTADIMALPDGNSVAIAETEQQSEWISGEQAFMERVREFVEDMIDTRRKWRGMKREAAVAALSMDHRFPRHFLQHLAKGRATTVSAYAFERLKEARQSELQAFLNFLRNEIAEINAGDDAESVLALSRELEEIEQELRRRVAARVAARKAASGGTR